MTSGVWGMSGAGSLAVAQVPTTVTLVRRKPFEFSFESIGKGLGFRVEGLGGFRIQGLGLGFRV